MIGNLLEWMGSTSWSIALRESQYVWPLLESTHVLTLCLFVGTAFITDLRLLGWTMKQIPVSHVTGRLLPWTRMGFVLMAVTGVLIFYSDPVRYYHNLFFRIKVILLIVAAINIYVFHAGIHRRVAQWDLDINLPREVRVAGAVSLLVWAFIVIAGRMIAYNWFDCGIQPQPTFVNWFAACAATS